MTIDLKTKIVDLRDIRKAIEFSGKLLEAVEHYLGPDSR
jgi:hypothetical protein